MGLALAPIPDIVLPCLGQEGPIAVRKVVFDCAFEIETGVFLDEFSVAHLVPFTELSGVVDTIGKLDWPEYSTVGVFVLGLEGV